MIIEFVDNIITLLIHRDKSLIHILEENVEFYSSIVNFVTWKFNDLQVVHEKKKSLLDTHSICIFPNMFQTL